MITKEQAEVLAHHAVTVFASYALRRCGLDEEATSLYALPDGVSMELLGSAALEARHAADEDAQAAVDAAAVATGVVGLRPAYEPYVTAHIITFAIEAACHARVPGQLWLNALADAGIENPTGFEAPCVPGFYSVTVYAVGYPDKALHVLFR